MRNRCGVQRPDLRLAKLSELNTEDRTRGRLAVMHYFELIAFKTNTWHLPSTV